VNKRILIVDNELSILSAFHRYFDRLGYIVDCARELEEAEALATCIEYDLAIVDLSLGEHDGTEGLEILRFVRRYRPQTRTILLTAHGSPAIEREAIRRGCDVVLHKPRPLDELAKFATELTTRCA
jgi:two-component system, NtrC family, response regulator AtoC